MEQLKVSKLKLHTMNFSDAKTRYNPLKTLCSNKDYLL